MNKEEPKLNRIHVGNVLELLRSWPDDFIHAAVTSPPYWGLRDYKTTPQIWGGRASCSHQWGGAMPHGRRGKRGVSGTGGSLNGRLRDSKQGPGAGTAGSFCQDCGAWRGELGSEPTPGLFIRNMVEIFREVRRCLRPDGTLWLNLGDCYANNGCGGHGATGGRDKSTLCGPLPPAGTVPVHRSIPPGLKAKDLILMPFKVAEALRDHGWFVRSTVIWNKPNPMPESVKDRPTTSHEYIFMLTKSSRYYYDAEAIKEKATQIEIRQDSRPRGFFEGKTEEMSGNGRNAFRALTEYRNKRTVWTVPTFAYPEAHFATFPPDLIRPCILASTSDQGYCAVCGCPRVRIVEATGGALGKSWNDHAGDPEKGNRIENPAGKSGGTYERKTVGWKPSCTCGAGTTPGIVFDPFMGSGTTGLVAAQYGRRFLGCELQPAYALMAERRVAAERDQEKLPL